MMYDPLVSIIVPVYNVENYLRKCLDSIINQTYQNIEIILVDDGSKDSSGKICDKYAKKDSRIKVIHKGNGGVSSARNNGLSIAKGEWLLFVDADDFLPEDAIGFYVKVVETEDVDMVLGSYVECDEEGSIIKFDQKQFEQQMSILECLRLFYKSDTTLFQGYIWNRLMRRSIILANNLKFNESVYFKEDGLFAVQYMVNCSRPCFYSSVVVYHYYIHSNSSMREYNSNFSQKYLTNLDARILCLKSIEQKYEDKDIINKAKYSILHFYHQILSRMDDEKIQNYGLRLSLINKVGSGLGWLYFLRFKLASIKSAISQKLEKL